jgi:hypothetical protein
VAHLCHVRAVGNEENSGVMMMMMMMMFVMMMIIMMKNIKITQYLMHFHSLSQ